MVRKNYFEILDGMNFNPSTEFDNLYILLSNRLLEELNHKFLNYQNRRTFIDFDEFLKFCLSQADNELEKLFIFTELLNDMLSIINPNHPLLRDDVYAVRENINRVLDLSNNEFLTLESGRQIIVEKNVYASEVSQIVSETSIQDAIKVLEYNHFANKGDVQRKKEILIALANCLEPFRRELNKHNNSNQYHLDLADDELEQWYDDIYTSTLFVILSMDESRILSKLKTLREG